MFPVRLDGLCWPSIYDRCREERCKFGRHWSPDFPLMDSHCHLDLMYSAHRTSLLDFPLPVSFKGCVTNFSHPRHHHTLTNILEANTSDRFQVWATVGIHPKEAWHYSSDLMAAIDQMAQHPQVVAIGETGIDNYHQSTNPGFCCQEFTFAAQCKLAMQHRLPIVVHCRQSEDRTLQVLQRVVPHDYPIHLHCFTGGWTSAQQFTNYFTNLYVGVAGLVTHQPAVQELSSNLPLNRMLLETDAPYLMPTTGNDECMTYTNPGMVICQAEAIAQLRGVSVGEVCNSTAENTRLLYSLY